MSIKIVVSTLLLAAVFLCGGCTAKWMQHMNNQKSRQGVSSSLVDYLYPNGEVPPQANDELPHLKIPLQVGLAFVPGPDAAGFTESKRQQLLENVKEQFRQYSYVGDIRIIPNTYLSARRGFKHLDQVARLYDVDVMALVSYDQVIHTDDTKSSLLYWTVLGAFFVNGSQFDTSTFVDIAVIDVATHKLLLRAPGVDDLKATSTLINSPEAMRTAQTESFEHAVRDMTLNLEKEMSAFKERLKSKEEKVAKVSYRSGYSGGGSLGLWLLFGLLLPLRQILVKRNTASRT